MSSSASSPSPAAASSPHPCDVFLSHSSADKPTVEQLARRLLDAGIHAWLDSWNLIPGDPWQEGLEEALDTCATCAVFLGPSGVGPWHNEELRVALDRRARDRTHSFRVIPVLLPGADSADPNTLPRFLSRMTWVDFRSGLDDANAFNRLLAGIRGVAPGPGIAPTTESSLHAASAVSSRPANSLTANQRRRLEDELARLQTQYDTYTRRLAALDTDIGRTLGTLERQVLEERRSDILNERQQVLGQIDKIEAQLDDSPSISPFVLAVENRSTSASTPNIRATVRLTVHLAYFTIDGTPAAFINITNLSKQDVVVTHIWIDYQPQLPVIQPDRIPPVKLKPQDTWETWIELERLPRDIGEDIYQRARVRLSSGEVIVSQRNEGVPDFGIVPGGPIRYRLLKPPSEK